MILLKLIGLLQKIEKNGGIKGGVSHSFSFQGGRMGRPRRWARQRRKSGAGFYKETSSLIYPIDEGINRRYVYFDKFKNKYMEVYEQGPIDVGQDQLIFELKDILNKAKQIQIKREKSFIEQLKSAKLIAEFNDSELFEGSLDNMRINYSNREIVNQYLSFLSKALISEEVKETLNEIIKVNVVQDSFQKALGEMGEKYPEEFFTKMSAAQEKNMTNKLQGLTWKYITETVKNDPRFIKSQIDFNRIKPINPGIQSALEGLGKISNVSKNKVMKVLKDRKLIGDINISGLNNNITGAIGEITNYLALTLGDRGKNFKSSTKSIGNEYGKTDLFTTITFPELTDKAKNLIRSISFSVKSSSLADDDSFARPAKLADQSSLTTRYEQIRNFIPNVDTGSLNKLFFHINNQLANQMAISKNKSIVEILGFASINWMFKDIVQEEQNASEGKDLNFYIINGKIIPVSMIFEFMEVQVENIGNHPEGIGRPSFRSPSPTVGDYYYKERDYQNRVELMRKENSRSVVWNEMRNYVEDKSGLGFYLNTARIKSMLRVENLKS